MIITQAPALKVLLTNLFDYAGLFPPAKLDVNSATKNYEFYLTCDHYWMLRWFVVTADKLDSVPKAFDGKLSVITNKHEPKAATIESKEIVKSNLPVYCETAPSNTAYLDEVKTANNFAKIRCGGLSQEAIPNASEVANFVNECAKRKLPFKATAGLHHPIRGEYNLTYEENSPRATMHGFLNVLMASAFAWTGEDCVEDVLKEKDPDAFSFSEEAKWKDKQISLYDLKDVRENFFHSIGSCSFEEPVEELKGLKLL